MNVVHTDPTLYALVGHQSGELLTYQQRVVVHADARELAFLIGGEGAAVVPCPPSVPRDQMMRLVDHPDMASVRFPLRVGDFRDPHQRAGLS